MPTAPHNMQPSYEPSSVATKRIAHMAGAVYVLLSVLTAFGFFHAPLVQTNLSSIAHVLVKSDFRFRIGVVADLLSMVLAVPLALLLYELFRLVDRLQAALLALFLLVAMPISFVVSLNYVAAQWLLTGGSLVEMMPPAQRESLAFLFLGLHSQAVLAVEIFWGLWLLPFGWLVLRSRYLPRVLGVLLLIGGVAYVAHSIASLLLGVQRIAAYERPIMVARAAAEFPTMLWLLIKGAKVPKAT